MPITGDLQYWRERILTTTLFFGVIFAFLPYIQGMFLAVQEHTLVLAIVDTVVYGMAIGLLLARRISFSIRAIGTMGILYAVGLAVLVYRGPVTSGLVYLLSFSLFGGILFGLKAATLTLVINAVTLSAIGLLINAGQLSWGIDLGISLGRWLVTSLNFFFLAGAASLSTAVLAKGLQASLLKDRSTSQELAIEVAERRRAEEALVISEERFRLAMQGANDGLWDWDLKSNDVYYSPRWKSMLGYDEGELEHHLAAWQRLVHPDDLEPTLSQVVDLLESRTDKFEVEFRMRHKDGNWIHILSRAFLANGTDGKPGRLVGTHVDITERKLAEKALQQQLELQSQFAKIAASVPGLVCSFRLRPDGSACMPFTTPAVLDLFGIEQHVLAEDISPWAANVHPDDRQHVNEAVAEAAKIPSPWHDVYRYIHPIKGLRWLEGRAMPQVEPDGSILWHGFVMDITERKIAEMDREKLETQLHQAHKMESVGRLAGGVAHDFNNMLGVIIGHTELALDLTPPGDLRHADLQEIQAAAQRSASLVRQLLAFARKQVASPKVIGLNETISGMLRMLKRLIGEDIELLWTPGSDLWKVRVDPSQIDQIFANLMVNARDAISGTGSIAIHTENVALDGSAHIDQEGFVPGEYVLMTISDTGAGMSGGILEHLFEPFFTTKEVGKGTGLGLATIYGIVRQNNGFIQVVSRPGQGSTFRVYLPRFVAKTPDSPEVTETEKRYAGTETILLVEDNGGILKLGKTILEKAGYKVLTACTPSEAIELAGKGTGEIHMLVTDVVLPEMNGRELVQRLQAIRPGLKHLYMSGYTADVIANRGVLDDGVRFISKPFKMDDFLKAVREVLEQE